MAARTFARNDEFTRLDEIYNNGRTTRDRLNDDARNEREREVYQRDKRLTGRVRYPQPVKVRFGIWMPATTFRR